jgi:hypothetical protein
MIPRLVWAPVSKESITAVKVSQAVSINIIRESVWLLSPHRRPGMLPGGGRM